MLLHYAVAAFVLSLAHYFAQNLQVDVHAAFGGVVPMLAMEAHKAAVDSCVSNALQQAGIRAEDLQAIAVSIGPGLSPCLQVTCIPQQARDKFPQSVVYS